MEFPLKCVVLNADVIEESINRRTNETMKARGQINVLTVEKGRPVVKNVTCSVAAARRFESSALHVGDTVKETTLDVDMSAWEVDGRSGVSIKLIEESTNGQQARSSFSMSAPSSPDIPKIINGLRPELVTK